MLDLFVLNQPALGAYRAQQEAARARGRWLMRCTRAETAARAVAISQVVDLHQGLRTGRRLDIIARQLRLTADELDQVTSRLNLQFDEIAS